MNFLYPSFLVALSAILIPVIIHLFNFQRPVKVLFTNVSFLEVVKESTSTRFKLKQILILLSRILFILFLVLAFAQPIILGSGVGTKDKSNVGVYLDNSYSMENELEDGKALDVVTKSLLSLIDLNSASTNYVLLTNNFEGRDLYKRNRDRFSERLSELRFSNEYRSADEVNNRFKNLGDVESKSVNSYYWFSDFQKSTMGSLENLVLDSLSEYYWIPVHNKDVSNVYIDSIWLGTPYVKVNQNNEINVKLNYRGSEDNKEVHLKLSIDGIQVSSAVAEVSNGVSKVVKIPFNITGDSVKKCILSIDDSPISFDNQYFFTINPSPKVKVLLVDDGNSSYLRNLFSNEDIFVVTSASSGSLDYSSIPVSNLIVINAVKNIPTSLSESIAEFVKKGGELIYVPASATDINNLNDFLKKLNISQVESYAADTLGDKGLYSLVPPDFNNPFFKNIFEKKDQNISMPYAFPVLYSKNQSNGLLKFKNGRSYLSEFASGKGKLFLFSSPFNSGYTNFPRHALFVPVLYKIGFDSFSSYEKLGYSFQDKNLTIELSDPRSENIFTMEGNGIKFIPDQRVSGKQLMIEIPEREMGPGFYSLVNKQGQTERIIALNFGKNESVMDFYSIDELKKFQAAHPNVKILPLENTDSFVNDFKNEDQGRPLWKYCLILCLLFLLTEILLIRFF
ncbi:MAG: BatA domain-containing protein [Sporocytophaga sp.]|nr:BatA domain-containing protein [Sporocytophaga sp.]